MNQQSILLDEEKAKEFLQAGLHYGQLVRNRNPKMDRFIYGVSKNGVQIINLNQTWLQIQSAGKLLQKLASEDKNILFVGTNKKAISAVLEDYADKYNLNFISSRWLGGTLTNPVTRTRINYLREIEGMEQSGLLDSFTAKERSFIAKKLKKLRKNLGGLKKIRGAIHAIVILDPMHEMNATLEALKKKNHMAIIAITDTNCAFALENFDAIIPCNLSSIISVRKILELLCEYIQNGRESQSTARQSSITSGRRTPNNKFLPKRPTIINKMTPSSHNPETKIQETSPDSPPEV